MRRKILSLLMIILLISALCSCSLSKTESAVQSPAESEEVVETTEGATESANPDSATSDAPSDGNPVFLGTALSPELDGGKLKASDYAYLAELADENSKFIFYTDGPSDEAYAFSLSQNDFWEMYWDAENPDMPREYSCTEIEYALRGPEVLLAYFTQKEGFVMADVPGEPLFVTSFVGSEFSAFNGDSIIDSAGSHTAYFEKNGLSIKCENVETQCYIGSNLMAVSGWEIGSIVKADVTCIKNSGKYMDLDWIPEEGKTEKVWFVLLYSAYNLPDEVRGIQMNDLWVL